jgi:hypothetical protein
MEINVSCVDLRFVQSKTPGALLANHALTVFFQLIRKPAVRERQHR